MTTRIKDYWSSDESPKVPSFIARATADDPMTGRADATLVREWWGPLFRGKRVLDLGAGPGRFVEMWAEFDVDLTCLEWSDAFFPLLDDRCRAVGARALQLDLTSEQIDETFDLVFATQVLLHIPPEDIAAAVGHMKAMMGGHAAILSWQGKDFDTQTGDKLQSFSHDYRALFEQAGLTVLLDSDVLADVNDARKRRNKLYYLSV